MTIEINDVNDLLMVPHLYKITETLKIAISLNIFGILKDKKLKITEIERISSCKKEKLQLILDMLCQIKLICHENDYFFNSIIAKKYLYDIKNLSHLLLYASDSNYSLKNLKPYLSDSWEEEEQTSIELYMKAMDEGNRFIAHSLYRKLKIKGEKNLLDLGCGSGLFSITVAKYNPLLKVTCIDCKEILKITKLNIVNSGVADQITLMPGDFLTMELQGIYDYILLSNVLHFYSANTIEILLNRLWNHLNSQGLIIILDIFRDKGSIMNILYALEWLSNGICFVEIPEICTILKNNNYKDIKAEPVKNSFSSLITASK